MHLISQGHVIALVQYLSSTRSLITASGPNWSIVVIEVSMYEEHAKWMCISEASGRVLATIE
jgi:hypothetical protein